MTIAGVGWEAAGTPGDGGDALTRETVALLIDEVARLEAELRSRDDREPADWPADPTPSPEDRSLRGKVDELTTELSGRDEMISVLLEQTQLFEEAAEAQRAEWEQLTRWVEEVEQRLDGRGGDGGGLAEELAAERRRSEQLALAAETERRAWEGHRSRLEFELAALRTQPGSVAAAPPGRLQNEVRQLRETCLRLERDAAQAAALRERLGAADEERERLRVELARERDERAREAKEAAVEVTALRSQLARGALDRPPAEGQSPPEGDLDPDQRIRAFRQHLRDLHEREARERESKGLASRLSRLWRSTGPG